MAQFDIVDLGTPDEKLRAVALMAAARTHVGKNAVYVVQAAKTYENYLRTGNTR